MTVFCLRVASYKFDDVFIWNVYCIAGRCLMSVKCFLYSHSKSSNSMCAIFYFRMVVPFDQLKKRLLLFPSYECCFFYCLFASRIVFVTDASTLCDFFFPSRVCFVSYIYVYWVFFSIHILWSLVNWLEL